MSFLIQRIQGDPGTDLQRTTRIQRLSVERLRIGRGAAADLRFADPALDLVHAVIQPASEGGWEVVDQGSVTGTYVNGKRVERTEVEEDDWIELGRHRLTVQPPGAEDMPLLVLVRELEEQIARGPDSPEGGDAIEVPEIDYRAAYSLERRGLRTTLSILCGLGALGILALLFGRSDLAAFRPGSVSDAHAGIADRCGACHRPWEGVVDELCVSCHAAPQHQPRQIAEPACGACHTEHRFVTELARVPNDRCVSCHASLDVADSGPARFAGEITDFASDHPGFALDLATSPGGGGTNTVRVSLEEAVDGKLDSTTLSFPHRKHLQAGLKSPRGPVQLDCFSCHEADRRGEIRPVLYEEHCQDCHLLTYDAGRPAAPHAEPEVLHAFLLRQYAERERPSQSLPEQRRLLPGRDRRSEPRRLDVDERVLRQVVETEYNLYRASCDVCHELDLEGVLPAVEPPGIPRDWFPYAEFFHQPHRMVECTVCHGRAVDSATAGDILLPGIRVCRRCHGPQTAREDSRSGATTSCVSCHAYHDASRTGSWGAERPGGTWETETGMSGPPAEGGS